MVIDQSLLVDAHSHLNEVSLSQYSEDSANWPAGPLVLTNSVNFESSLRNLELGRQSKLFIPFVGIHPEIFRQNISMRDRSSLRAMVDKIGELITFSSGIGEVGLDPKYGSVEEQERLFVSLLELCEKSSLPVTIHSRDSVGKILEILSGFNLKGKILFHWFAGTESELKVLEDRGIFVSYGPSILYSKRMSRLAEKSRMDLILSETDSPTPYASLTSGISTPYFVASVVFKLSMIKGVSFDTMKEWIHRNVVEYLGTQTSLRVK